MLLEGVSSSLWRLFMNSDKWIPWLWLWATVILLWSESSGFIKCYLVSGNKQNSNTMVKIFTALFLCHVYFSILIAFLRQPVSLLRYISWHINLHWIRYALGGERNHFIFSFGLPHYDSSIPLTKESIWSYYNWQYHSLGMDVSCLIRWAFKKVSLEIRHRISHTFKDSEVAFLLVLKIEIAILYRGMSLRVDCGPN
jgi:hypothetical protein